MRCGSKQSLCAALAQLVEHRIRNAGVVGSNPISGTIVDSREPDPLRASVSVPKRARHEILQTLRPSIFFKRAL
jgi:hypothetical protein